MNLFLPSLTFINHATILLQLNGVNILTDPVYSFALGYYIPRLRKPGIRFHELPQVNVILVSHADYDHLNLKTLRRLRRKHQSRIIFPQGLSKYGRRTGFEKVEELDLWQNLSVPGLTITCVPAQHSNKRLPWDRKKTLACGFVIESAGSIVYFAGDTGHGGHFKEIGRRFRIDVALLPVGAYKPYEWFEDIHLNPETASKAFQDLQARILVPIPWRTFKISDEPLREPPILLRQKARDFGILDKLQILENGESLTW